MGLLLMEILLNGNPPLEPLHLGPRLHLRHQSLLGGHASVVLQKCHRVCGLEAARSLEVYIHSPVFVQLACGLQL